MKSYMTRIFSIEPGRWRFWVIAAILFKLAFLLFKIITRTHTEVHIDGFFGFADADAYAYLSPVDNLVHTGSYTPDYRMPGYGAFYFPFILLFSKGTACNLMILSQLLISAVSVYVLALTARNIFKSNTAFYIAFVLYSLSCYTSCFDGFLLTESITTSFLIFAVYLFILYFEKGRYPYIFLSGAFLTWAIFCRPVLLPFLFFFFIFLVLKAPRRTGSYLLFFSSFIICDAAWIRHNYKAYHIIAPLLNNTHTFFNPIIGSKTNAPKEYFTNGLSPDTVVDIHALMEKYGQAWGAPTIYELDDIFFNERNHRLLLVNTDAVPQYSYTSKFNRDSLEKLNRMIDTVNLEGMTNRQKRALAVVIDGKIDNYIASLKKEKPFVYYIKAPLILLRRFVMTSGSQLLFDKPVSRSNPAAYAIKLLFALLYYFVLVTAVFGMIWMWKRFFNFRSFQFLIMGIALYIILVHPLVLRFCDWRYSVPAYPFLLLCSVAGLAPYLNKMKGNRK